MIAHKLKGLSGTLGAARLAAVAAEIERHARAGAVGEDQFIPTLEVEFRIVNEALAVSVGWSTSEAQRTWSAGSVSSGPR